MFCCSADGAPGAISVATGQKRKVMPGHYRLCSVFVSCGGQTLDCETFFTAAAFFCCCGKSIKARFRLNFDGFLMDENVFECSFD